MTLALNSSIATINNDHRVMALYASFLAIQPIASLKPSAIKVASNS